MNKICSQCKEEKHVDYFYKNRDEKCGYRRQCKQCTNSYNATRTDKKREYDYYYRIKNRERIKKVKDLYHLNNRELENNKGHVRRARKSKNGVFAISKKELIKLYNSPCFYCGSLNKITIDHIIPISRGGSHSIGNLVSACAFCNGSKHTKFIVEWKRDLTFLKKAGRVD